jgi:transcriptional regulator GlxA family with amidase domain
MLLAAAGLTQGRHATTHHVAREALRATGAVLVDARVVDDGDLITTGGITSGLDLALWLVEREAGAALALELERHLEYERRGTVWRRPRD